MLRSNPAYYFKGNFVSELKENKIYISQRGKSIRFAPHLYVNKNDIERLLENISQIIKN